MKNLSLYLVFLFVCIGGRNEAVAQARGKITVLEAARFQKKFARSPHASLIDVRTPEEFKAGHLSSAANYNLLDSTLHRNLSEIDRKKPVFIYCQSGRRSARAALLLKDAGFRVYEMSGGFLDWQEKELPVVAEE